MTLRRLRRSDAKMLAAWLPRTAEDIGCDRRADADALAGAARDRHVLVVDDGGHPAGLLTFDAGTPTKRAARVSFLAIEPERRRVGTGGRAVLALERKLRREAEAVYVAVPSETGLALYFWLRLGYRPLRRADWPRDPERLPATWLVRELR